MTNPPTAAAPASPRFFEWAPVARVLVVFTVAVMLALAEVQRLAAQYVSSLGTTFVVGDVVGVGAWNKRTAWDGWTPDNNPAQLIFVDTVLDLVFIALYVSLAWLAITRGLSVQSLGDNPTDAETETHRVAKARRSRAVTWLRILLAAELLEDTQLFIAAGLMPQAAVPEWLTMSLATCSLIKWLATVLLVVSVLRGPNVRAGIALWFRRTLPVLYTHRIGVVVVGVLIGLSLVPGALVLEQLPDIERSWFDPDGFHVFQAVFGVVAILGTGLTFLLIGRKRSKDYGNGRALLDSDPPTDPPFAWARRMYLVWFAIPVLAGIGGIVAALRGWQIEPGTFWTFIGVTFAIPAISLIFEAFRFRQHELFPGPAQRPRLAGDTTATELLRMTRGGDLLALLMISIALLGLARSLLPYLALGGYPLEWLYAACVGIAVIGAASLVVLPEIYVHEPGAPATPPPATAIVQEFSTTLPNPGTRKVRLTSVIVALAVSVTTIVISVVAPIWFAGWAGGVGVLLATLTAWTTLVGLLILLLRRARPLAVFSAMGLRSDPVIVLFLLVPVVIATLSPAPGLHDIDQSSTAIDDRPSLDQAFTDWLTRTDGCSVDGARPLILIASEGGGIRADVWTTAVLAEISKANPCLANSVFLSSGVSGGSVGLAIAANSGQSVSASDTPVSKDELNAAAKAMLTGSTEAGRGPALASAVAGLLVTDPLASAVGIRTPNIGEDAWRDRASLIEDSWRAAVPGLGNPFDTIARAPTGIVVFNSTDLVTGCRVSTSQVRLDDGSDSERTAVEQFAAQAPACKQGTDEPPLTVDLVSRYKLCGGYKADWATSSMLSARFPYVTPSGRVDIGIKKGGCPSTRLQIIDGGYAESSGLGLIADIAPKIGNLVRNYNSSTTGDIVVPYLMYLQNSPGGYTPQEPRTDTTQLAVPIVGQETKNEQLATSSWVQRIMSSLAVVCNDHATTAGCRDPDRRTSQGGIAARTIIVAVDNTPAVNVPLGWTLSATTEKRLTTDASEQAQACPIESDAYNCLADLIHMDWPKDLPAAH